MKCTRMSVRCVLTIAVATTLASVPRRADATLPGKNGSQQLTFPTDNAYDFSPSVSPDGAHVAFLRQLNVTGSGYI